MPEVTFTPDILPDSKAPALSATSDMPVFSDKPTADPVVITPAAKEPIEAKPEAKPELKAEEPKADPEASKPEPEAKVETADKKPPKGINERFSELSAKNKAAETRADKLADSLEKALGAIDKLTPKPDPKAAEAADPRPTRETFDNPDAYETALIEWSSRKASTLARAEAEKERLETEQAQKASEAKKRQDDDNAAALDAWNAKRAKAIETYPDFAEVAENEAVTISVPMGVVITQSEIGPQIAYYLGKNPEEAAKIAALPHPAQQALAIGRIEAKLLLPKVEISKAPEPIKPLGSKSRAVEKTVDEMSMDEYGARRTAEIIASRRPFVGTSAKPR